MIDQIAIAALSVAGIFLTNSPNPRVRRYGCILGLLVQPFWFYTSYQNAQWGIFFATFFYSAAWARGIYHQWIRRQP